MNIDDRHLIELIHRIADRNHWAMEELHRHTRLFLGHAVRKLVFNPSDAEEVLQDVYKHIWLNAHHYSPERGSVCGWLHLIARSRATDRLRRTQRLRCESPLDDRDWAAHSPAPDELYLRARRHRDLHRHLRILPDTQRELVELAFYHGFSHSEIATRQGLPLGTVKTRLRSALGKMKESLAA